jgi:dCMP deaminase
MLAAHNVALRSNCIRRSVGAVLVRDEEVVSVGWNGVSSRYKNCREAGCPRCIQGGSTGSGYEFCICIHAEQMAIGDAAARGAATKGSSLYVNLRPCLQCLAIMRTAGVTEVFFDENWVYSEPLERIYQQLAAEFRYFGYLHLADANAGEIRRIA